MLLLPSFEIVINILSLFSSFFLLVFSPGLSAKSTAQARRRGAYFKVITKMDESYAVLKTRRARKNEREAAENCRGIKSKHLRFADEQDWWTRRSRSDTRLAPSSWPQKALIAPERDRKETTRLGGALDKMRSIITLKSVKENLLINRFPNSNRKLISLKSLHCFIYCDHHICPLKAEALIFASFLHRRRKTFLSKDHLFGMRVDDDSRENHKAIIATITINNKRFGLGHKTLFKNCYRG